MMGDRRLARGPAEHSEADRFAEVYEAHVDAVFAYALSRTGADRAAEVVEETFFVAWRRLSDLPAEPRPWLFGVARRAVANQRRASARQTALGQRVAAFSSSLSAEPDHAERVVEHDRLLAALARLGDPDRELLCISAWGGLSPKDAAGVLGCTKAAFLVRLHRARRRFEAALQAEDADVEAVGPGKGSHVAPAERPPTTIALLRAQQHPVPEEVLP